MKITKEKETLEKAVNLCLENVERYIKDAELLIADSSYGHAYSLMVLAEEELTKTTVYYLCAQGIVNPKALKKTLLSHSSKHALQAGVQAGMRFAHDFFFEVLGNFFLTGKKENEPVFETLSVNKLEEAFLEAPKREASAIQEAMQKERSRQRGFYVDIDFDKKRVWSPKSIPKVEAERYLSKLKSRYS
ncbi:MAG: AbiV family abortive infection protein, partial [Candidatus Bathyarchaeota archaeon]|nr:AbiV family abortive infection protein [Candidatus Bathyarchaeota archaeon]